MQERCVRVCVEGGRVWVGNKEVVINIVRRGGWDGMTHFVVLWGKKSNGGGENEVGIKDVCLEVDGGEGTRWWWGIKIGAGWAGRIEEGSTTAVFGSEGETIGGAGRLECGVVGSGENKAFGNVLGGGRLMDRGLGCVGGCLLAGSVGIVSTWFDRWFVK